MNRKAFTLVEIIAVIVILGLIVLLIAPSLSTSGEKSKEKVLATKIQDIELAASNWAMSNDESIAWFDQTCSVQKGDPESSIFENIPCKVTVIKVQKLIDEKFYSADKDGNVLNPVNKQVMNKKNVVIKKYLGSYYSHYQK